MFLIHSASSGDVEWSEWKFLSDSDVSSANVYTSDVLSIASNLAADVADTDNTVESAECWSTMTTDSLDSGELDLHQCKPDVSVSQRNYYGIVNLL